MQASWSPDGKWIYFVSNRSGSRQIWRMPAGGGEAVPMTEDGGEFARASQDGRALYFTRGEYGSLGLWKKDLESGVETHLEAPPIYDWGFCIANSRLYFTAPLSEGNYPIIGLDLQSGKAEVAGRIGFSPFAKFSVSQDGNRVVYSLQEKVNSDLMLVENFR
jgi:Tol biopolymer transport system component